MDKRTGNMNAIVAQVSTSKQDGNSYSSTAEDSKTWPAKLL